MANVAWESLYEASDEVAKTLGDCWSDYSPTAHKNKLGLFQPWRCPICKLRGAIDAVADAEQVDPEDRVGALDLAIDEMKSEVE